MPTRRPLLLLAATLAATLAAGCSGLPGAKVAPVDGRPLEYVARSGSAPVIVFENGLGGHMEWWQKVLPALDADRAYFAYNRPGYGRSEPARTPRDGAHVVEELRAALSQLGLPPPYVLVGHSLGGLYMQLFARQHPQDVAALVLVDSTHPRQLEGAGAMEKQSFWVRGLVGALVTGVARQELDQLNATGEQVLALPAPPTVPVVVLSASGPLKDTSELANFANEKRRDVARLYPGSRQVWVDSGHAIPLERPDAIAQALRDVLAPVRRGAPAEAMPASPAPR